MRFEKTRHGIVTITASALLAAGLVSFGPATTAASVPGTVRSVAAAEALAEKEPRKVSFTARSSTRPPTPKKVEKKVVAKKKEVKKKKVVKPAKVKAIASNSGANRAIGRKMAADKGWTGEQWTCLNNLWTKESGWRAVSPNKKGSSAYGIPQALPGSKMATAGSDWRTNPATQIKWGLKYIDSRYGTPCGGWRHFLRKNWY